jgi:hypothetical protein
MCAPLIWSFKRPGASSPPSASRTMAVSTALKKKTSFFGYHTFSTNGLVFGLCLRRRAIAIDSAGNNCHCQDDGRRDNGRRRALDFEKGHHKTPLPLISSSPPKYPAAAINPEANNIKIRYRHRPNRDGASLTTRRHTAKATSSPNAGQTNRLAVRFPKNEIYSTTKKIARSGTSNGLITAVIFRIRILVARGDETYESGT